MSKLHKRLKRIRSEAGLTLEDVGKAMPRPVSKAAIQLWECENPERRTEPSSSQLITFSKITGVPIEMIIDDSVEISGDWSVELDKTKEGGSSGIQILELMDIFRTLSPGSCQKVINLARRESNK